MSATKRLTTGRLRCLQGLAFGALELSSDEKAKLVERLVPGKTSFRELDNAEADRVIDAMKGMAGQPVTRPQLGDRRRARRGAVAGDVAMLITPAQRDLIAELTRALIDAGIRSTYLAGVRLRACGRPSPATSDEAEKTIEALKGLKARVDGGWRPSGETA